MGVLEKIRKRRLYPVELPNGETIHIRSLRFPELRRMAALAGEAKIGFVFGLALIEDDGSQVYEIGDGETDEAFGKRVAEAAEQDMDTQTLVAVKDAFEKLHKVPSVKVIAKNSEETSTPG